MKNWEEMLHEAEGMKPVVDVLGERIMMPVGYDENGALRTMTLGLSRDVHGLIIGAQNTDVTTLVESMCEAVFHMYERENVTVHIYDIRDRYDKFIRHSLEGTNTFHTNIATDNEFVCMMEDIQREVQDRYRILSLVGCKNCYTWNMKLKKLIGQEMTKEEVYCFRPTPKEEVWSEGCRMNQKVLFLDGALDYIYTLPSWHLSQFERTLSVVLKLSRATGIHVVLTGTSVGSLKTDFIDCLTSRVVFNTDDRACHDTLNIVSSVRLDRYEARVQGIEDGNKWHIVNIPEFRKRGCCNER